MLTQRLSPLYSLAAVTIVLLIYFSFELDFQFSSTGLKTQQPFSRPSTTGDGRFQWHTRPDSYPVTSMIPLPSGKAIKLPRIQHDFSQELPTVARERNARRNEVRNAFMYAWTGYKKHAWMKDELAPISGISRSHFGGWAATLVDSLDTLWIMGLKEEFEEAVASVVDIDFSSADQEEISTFETNIRYLGGLLAAYDLSGGQYSILLQKAVELADMLYAAFDTPNRLPIPRWRWKLAKNGSKQESSFGMLLAELGSFSLEFTRLSQVSGDPKFFDAIQRITDLLEKHQGSTKLPGLFPVAVNAKEEDFSTDGVFSLGAMADSFYEYLPKEYILLGGLSKQYRTMYEYAIDAAKKHLFFRPMAKEKVDLLIPGNIQVNSTGKSQLDPQGQHLGCFVGGMVGIGSRIFNRPEELTIARQLVDGCIWAYQSMPTGIMPEMFQAVPCENTTACEWDEAKWYAGIAQWHEDFSTAASPATQQAKILDLKLAPGFSEIVDRRYLLRPEAIESIFILYRITGDEKLREDAWKMFELIDTYTRAEFGHASLSDTTVVPPPKFDSMESFWTAETLKYFYLIFSEPDLVNLDNWVFNTEAHPFKRPHPG